MTTSWATAARVVPGLDHDPCPGDVPGVRGLSEDLRARADRVHAAAAVCRGWRPSTWRGQAAGEAVAAVAALADRLLPLQHSLEGAAGVLQEWAAELAVLQEQAAALGAAGLELRRRQLAAALATAPFVTPTEQMLEHHRLRDERRALQRRVDDLHVQWLAASRRRSADLDATAPPGSA